MNHSDASAPQAEVNETKDRQGWSAGDTACLAAVTLGGASLIFVRLATPARLIFDETFYAQDACFYAQGAEGACGVAAEQTAVHPPLGKLLIGAGIEVFGYDSFGWRVAAAAAGSLTIALLFVLARRILGSRMGAVAAAGLLAIDPLHFVQSRVAMLDVFVALFGVAVFTFLALDRDRPRGDCLGDSARNPYGPWRIAAGVAAGAAVASKWSGGLVLAAALIVSLAWEVGARRADGRGRAVSRALVEQGPALALCLLALPLGVYLCAYWGRLDGDVLSWPWGEGSWARAWWDRQLFMYDFHSNLSRTHGYQSPPWSWPLLKRPVSYFFDATDEGDYREVLATGSPYVWWSALLALGYIGCRWIRHHDARGPEGLILAGSVLLYAPWLLLAGSRGAVFLFYLLPAVPFMCLALGYMAARLVRYPGGRAAVAAFAAGALIVFGSYYPFLAAVGIPEADWRKRMTAFDHCPEAPEDLPPEGWCWI